MKSTTFTVTLSLAVSANFLSLAQPSAAQSEQTIEARSPHVTVIEPARTPANQMHSLKPQVPTDYAQKNDTPEAALPGCTRSKQRSFELVLGAMSHCMGGGLSGSERAAMVFDSVTQNASQAAQRALSEDPRQIMRLPRTASAGVSISLTQNTHIGVEYSFSESSRTSPFQFRTTGHPADELAGHSATLRVGLSL